MIASNPPPIRNHPRDSRRPAAYALHPFTRIASATGSLAGTVFESRRRHALDPVRGVFGPHLDLASVISVVARLFL